MNREIKFKAFHIEEKIMGDVKTLTDQGAFVIGVAKGEDKLYDGGKSIILAPEDGRFCMHEEIHLLQFSGLYDSFNNPIYEGDIIKYNFDCTETKEDYDINEDLSFQEIGVVEFEDGCFVMKNEFTTCTLELDDEYITIEVLGNQFQKPELLENESK
jgi:uncharacterized phage protein (TIGR01671 family)